MRQSLEQIRLELRGPIAESPFAGRKKQPKLDYCDRQIKLYSEQYDQSGIGSLLAQMHKWEKTRKHVEAGKL